MFGLLLYRIVLMSIFINIETFVCINWDRKRVSATYYYHNLSDTT